MLPSGFLRPAALVVCLTAAALLLVHAAPAPSPIRFELRKIPFRLENDETSAKNAPESMAGGVAVFDYNGDGKPDIFFTNGANIATLKKDDPKYRDRLFRNNGDGTFTDVTAKAGVADGRWSTGAAFGDYDNDGYVDLMVANYVDLSLSDLPQFGSAPYCKYRGIDVQCGPRGLRGAGDAHFHNNGDGTFTNDARAAGVDDPSGYYG